MTNSFQNLKHLEEQDGIQQKKFENRLLKLRKKRLDNQEHCYIRITEKNEFEKIKTKTDHYPLLRFRKFLLTMYQYVIKFCYHIVKNPIFEFISMMIIITNSVILMMDSALDQSESLSDKTEFTFMVLYTVETAIKSLGYGFWRSNQSILRDYWNLFDFLIVLLSWINFLLEDVHINFSPLRSLKVLRPLKTFSKIQKLKKLIMTIFKSIPHIIDILFILFFVYLIFAIGGLVLFNGVLKKRCVDSVTQKIM